MNVCFADVRLLSRIGKKRDSSDRPLQQDDCNGRKFHSFYQYEPKRKPMPAPLFSLAPPKKKTFSRVTNVIEQV